MAQRGVGSRAAAAGAGGFLSRLGGLLAADRERQKLIEERERLTAEAGTQEAEKALGGLAGDIRQVTTLSGTDAIEAEADVAAGNSAAPLTVGGGGMFPTLTITAPRAAGEGEDQGQINRRVAGRSAVGRAAQSRRTEIRNVTADADDKVTQAEREADLEAGRQLLADAISQLASDEPGVTTERLVAINPELAEHADILEEAEAEGDAVGAKENVAAEQRAALLAQQQTLTGLQIDEIKAKALEVDATPFEKLAGTVAGSEFLINRLSDEGIALLDEGKFDEMSFAMFEHPDGQSHEVAMGIAIPLILQAQRNLFTGETLGDGEMQQLLDIAFAAEAGILNRTGGGLGAGSGGGERNQALAIARKLEDGQALTPEEEALVAGWDDAMIARMQSAVAAERRR